MKNNIISKIVDYENNFILFQRELPKLREIKPNQFVAFKNGKLIASGLSVEDISKELNSKGIEPSETVIEFVSKNEIKVII